MAYLNLPPAIKDLFDGMLLRIIKLENASRFTAPNVTTDPTTPRKGDIWLNTTTNQLKTIDANGATRVINWT